MTPNDEPKPDPELTERLAAEFHDVYQEEARRQGDVRHKDSYAELSENIKEFDRVLARHVIRLLRAERVKVRRETLEEAAVEFDKRAIGAAGTPMMRWASQFYRWLAQEVRALAETGEPTDGTSSNLK